MSGMTFAQWLPLFTVCLLGAMSPGPSLAVVMGATINRGAPAGLASALAHGVGVALYGLLTVTGLAVLIAGSPTLFGAIQLAGALFLIYLGVKSLRSAGGSGSAEQATGPGSRPIRDGFLVAFLNPKLAVFMLALFSQFLRPDAGLGEKGIMVATVGVTDAAWYCLVAMLVSRPGFLRLLRAKAVWLDRLFGCLLILVALSVLAAMFGGLL